MSDLGQHSAPVDSEQAAEAVKLYRDGVVVDRIMERTGLRRDEVYDALKAAGIRPNRQRPRPARTGLFDAIDEMYGHEQGAPAPMVGHYVRLVHEQERELGRLEARLEAVTAAAGWFRAMWVAERERHGGDSSDIPPWAP